MCQANQLGETKKDASHGWGTRRLFFLVLLLVPTIAFVLGECGHYVRFGHFFRYGYHTDLVEDHSDIGVPRLHTAYRLRITNYTLFPLKFEGIQLGPGITDGDIIFHDRLEKWSQQTNSWSTVFDGAELSSARTNEVVSIWPGHSIYPTGSYEIVTVNGVEPGDTVRLVAFTLRSKMEGALGQHEFFRLPLP